MAKKSGGRHVVPRGDKWANVKAGADRATGLHDTQAEAIKSARQGLRKSGGGELNIHGTDGKIRKKDTVPDGNDPYPPKG